MRKDREDDSLEDEPGGNGITFSIGDIPNIHNKAKEISNNFADSTTMDIKGDYREWLIGESEMPHSMLWEFHPQACFQVTQLGLVLID